MSSLLIHLQNAVILGSFSILKRGPSLRSFLESNFHFSVSALITIDRNLYISNICPFFHTLLLL